jgi:nuclear cap-binding protein subunit 1
MLQDSFEKAKFLEVKYLVRFIAELVNANVLLPSSIIDLFHQFISLIDENYPQRADYFAHLIMMTLPWVRYYKSYTNIQVGKELNDRKPEELVKLLANLENYMKKRTSRANPILCPYSVDSVSSEQFTVN